MTADEEEGEGEGENDAAQRAAAALGSKVEAAKDMASDAKSNLGSLKAKAKAELGEAVDRADGDDDDDGDGEEAEEGDLRARLPQGGKVDVSYV